MNPVTIGDAEIYHGDCLDVLSGLPAKSVQTCVTSPPYFGLRDYGHPGQLGLESTPEEYISNMVEVFRAVRDVLSDDGTLWLNIGDSYASSDGIRHSRPQRDNSGGLVNNRRESRGAQEWTKGSTVSVNRRYGMKPKDLIGIPWMLAFALRADGWYLRQDIIWHKPNPMPESVRDRCTKAHEYIFLLSKSARYYYDAEAILEDAKWERWGDQTVGKEQQGTAKWIGNKSKAELQAIGKKNRRSVWSVATRPYKGAHFATFPPALIEPCILAGSKPGDIVLDPFFGSATTGQVAQDLARNWIGCELNAEYEFLQRDRLGLFYSSEIG